MQRRAVIVWGKPGSGKSLLRQRLVLESLLASAGGAENGGFWRRFMDI